MYANPATGGESPDPRIRIAFRAYGYNEPVFPPTRNCVSQLPLDLGASLFKYPPFIAERHPNRTMAVPLPSDLCPPY